MAFVAAYGMALEQPDSTASAQWDKSAPRMSTGSRYGDDTADAASANGMKNTNGRPACGSMWHAKYRQSAWPHRAKSSAFVARVPLRTSAFGTNCAKVFASRWPSGSATLRIGYARRNCRSYSGFVMSNADR